jgi:hypothetical protein
MNGVGRLAGSLVDESLTYRGGKDRLYPKSPADINYEVADNQKELEWGRFRQFNLVNSPDSKPYGDNVKIDLDINRKETEDYRNQTKFGGILSVN